MSNFFVCLENAMQFCKTGLRYVSTIDFFVCFLVEISILFYFIFQIFKFLDFSNSVWFLLLFLLTTQIYHWILHMREVTLKAFFQKGLCNVLNIVRGSIFNPNHDVSQNVTKYYCCLKPVFLVESEPQSPGQKLIVQPTHHWHCVVRTVAMVSGANE